MTHFRISAKSILILTLALSAMALAGPPTPDEKLEVDGISGGEGGKLSNPFVSQPVAPADTSGDMATKP